MDATERCLYVLFSRQHTKIGRFIRIFMRNSRYSHVTVALDSSLYAMYSFSRLRHDSPFSGSFTREHPVHFFVDDKDVTVKLCRVELDEEAYRCALARIEHCKTHATRMLYNLYDALALPFRRRVRMRDAYTCVDFAAFLLGMDARVDSIGALEQELADCCIYEGSLQAFLAEKCVPHSPEDDDYFVRRGILAAMGDFITLQTRLWRRYRNESARVG